MGYEETFELNGDQIKTTVTSDGKEIEKHISSFMLPSKYKHVTKVIGFDAECYLVPGYYKETRVGISSKSRCATIQFRDGHSCLIIQLNRLRQFDSWNSDLAKKSLLNFLRMPNVTFVGVGIKDNLEKLEKNFGIGCRNAVELGQLAATAMRKPRLSFCGVDELAFLVSGLDLEEQRPVSTASYDYTYNPLSKELVKLATVNVYSYYKIGRTLLQCDVVAGHNGDLPVHLW